MYRFHGPPPHRQQAGYSATELRSPKNNILFWPESTRPSVFPIYDSALDISYMSNGNNIDYGGDKVFAGNYRSDYLWYAMLGGTNSRAKAELNGAFFNITRPRNIAFNYIVRAA